MTYIQKFAPEDEQDFEPDYPTAFGITFTPMVTGIVFTAIGLAVGGWLWTSRVQPIQEKNATLKQEQQKKLADLKSAQKTDIAKERSKLNEQLQDQQKLKGRILGLFSDQQTFDTLLLDINKRVTVQGAKLTSYKIEEAEPTIINDGSLGPLVNGKLKRQTVSLEIEGDFDQTENILRDIERLQTLLLIEDVNSRQTEQQTYLFDGVNFRPQNSPKVTTEMTVKVLLPLTPQEKQARKAAEEAAKSKK